MAEPIRALQSIPSITLPVQFQDGLLWQARYPSLIRADLVPELQFEPAFQVCSDEVEVQFTIAEDENAAFLAVEGEVSWQSLVGGPAPRVVVTLVDGDPKRCRVHWTRSGAPLTALRIVCEPLVRTTDPAGTPDPSDDPIAALMKLEAGVYLAVIDLGEMHPFPKPLHNQAPPTVQGRVQVVGIDRFGRPVYDLFKETSMPPELAPEPAIRARHGESFEFDLALALPDPYTHVRFKTDEHGQVVMTYVVPSERPEELESTQADDDNRLCQMQWSAPFCTPSTCTQGMAANLYAQLDPGPLGGTPLGDAIARVRIDPTVIEPPPCDANGVCTKPREEGD